ncbi:sporulation integral membrane protein YtvI [Bacillus sp. FJAT-45350]|uniref:sporulation integral membrane protein YtvI n=1 Tax=Bacillus sp. FJAT-45350 TaxID=2011014 RepID=UPI000BB85CAF|nr:sporulation integral membrane protein YtvI [Bacillus sp. FJAT-45350]
MNKEALMIFIRITLMLAIISILILTSYYVTAVIYPFILGLALAFLINPIVNFLENSFKLKRAIAVLLTLAIAFTVLTALVTLLIAEVISGSNYLATTLPLHIKKLMNYLDVFFITTLMPLYEQFIRVFNNLEVEQQSTIMNYVQTFSSQLASNIGTGIQHLFNGLSDLLLSLPNLATVIIFSFMATFFISKDWYRLRGYLIKVTPEKVATSISRVMHDLKRAMFGYMFAQLTLISITCVIVLSGLLIIGVDYPITIAISIAVVDLIPYLGTGLIFIPWIIYTFFAEQHTLTIGLSILYGIVVIQRQVMEPKILSQNIGVDPLAMLLALFVGFQLFGLLGLMLGPAFLVFLRTLYRAKVFHDMRDFILKK